MPDAQPPKQELTDNQKKAGNKGLSLTQKVIIVLIAIFIVGATWWVVFGGIKNIYEFIIIIFFAVVLVVIGYIIIKAIGIITAKRYPSMKENYYTRLVNIAIASKPDNVYNLYFVGDRMKKGYKAGKIVGCMQVPHLVGQVKKDKDGNPITAFSEKLKKEIVQFEQIWLGISKDTFFIVEHGFLLPKREYIRCDRALHSELNGDVFIYDVNPVPYGTFFQYPLIQLQRDAPKIMLQNQLEIILMTHEYQYDLISQATDIGMYTNPQMTAIREQGQEIAGE